ncbi:MAG: hypothetical protein HUU49_03475 [Candidatus Buchananbacteria bacterium]|nr:hypothetical protein [Candidatus Buchananbacteria bacterium]
MGRDDEAAFAQALAQLDAVGQAKVLTRMKSLGNPDAADTPEARSFRLSFVTLPDLASRVEVMKMIADMPDSKWHDFVDVTGFANSGDLLKSLREFYRRFEIELAVIMLIMGAAAVYVAGALVRGDENAARRLEAGAAGLEEVSAKVRRWEESQDTKLRQQKRGFWSWLWPW